MRRVYLVHVPEFVIVVDVDPQDFLQRDLRAESEAWAADRVRTQLLSRAELRRRGDEVPEGCWDPDRELTCAEIAADMPRYETLCKAERLGAYAALLLELVA